MGVERAMLIVLGLSALAGLVLVVADLWGIKRAADREVDAVIDGR